MRARTYILYGVLALVGLFTACHRTQPQKPTFLGDPATDSAAIALVSWNQKLADEADRAVVQTVKNMSDTFALHENGVWYKSLHRNEGNLFGRGDVVLLHYRVWAMDSTLLMDTEESYQVGKQKCIPVIDYFVPLMTDGDKLTFIVPWYMAYGATGNEHVEPYENLIIELLTTRE